MEAAVEQAEAFGNAFPQLDAYTSECPVGFGVLKDVIDAIQTASVRQLC